MHLRPLIIVLLGIQFVGCSGSEQPTASTGQRDEFDIFNINQNPDHEPGSYDHFQADTLITFHLRQDGPVTVTVSDTDGTALATVIDEYRTAGDYSLLWDGVLANGTIAPPGIYFYHVRQGVWVMTGGFIRPQ